MSPLARLPQVFLVFLVSHLAACVVCVLRRRRLISLFLRLLLSLRALSSASRHGAPLVLSSALAAGDRNDD